MDKETLMDFLVWVHKNTFYLNNEWYWGKYADYDFDKNKPISYQEVVEKYYEMQGIPNYD